MLNDVKTRRKLVNSPILRAAIIGMIYFLPGLGKAVYAVTLHVAVASNFLAASKALALQFQAISGISVSISSGSTGKLYAQIINGAPYDVFMAANAREPGRLVKGGLALADSRLTYAVGRLALYSSRIILAGKQADFILKSNHWDHLAIANPTIAPYGVAAREVLQHLGIWRKVQPRLIKGENIGQTFYFARSGNVALGLVALSQVKSQENSAKLQYVTIPRGWYQPIEQQAVILSRSRIKIEARAFLEFLHSPAVMQLLIEKYGYGGLGK